MSKLQNKPPTGPELQFVQSVLLKGEAPLWIRWVTKRKRDKVQDRLIVIGKYRVFSIKKTLTGKKQVQRVGHLYDLKEIICREGERVLFKFDGFEIDMQAEGASSEVIEIIRKAIQSITTGYPNESIAKVTYFDDRTIPALSPAEPGIAGGLLNSYDAWCDYFKVVPSQEFIKFVTDSISLGKTELNLDECPGLERKSDPLNFLPVRNALRYNTHFSTIRLRNVPTRRDITLLFGDFMSYNYTVTTLELIRSGAPDDAFVNLGQALKKNPYNVLREVDFTGNPMKDKGAAGFAEGLQSFNHTLVRFDAPFCGLTAKGIASIVQALSFGQQVSTGLQEIDLSHNNIGQAGSLHLSNLFSQMAVVTNLKYLFLSNCKLDTALIVKSLKNGNCRTLEALDLSGNKLDVPAAQSLASLVDTLNDLSMLNLSHCSMQGGQANTILSAIVGNQQIRAAKVNISFNELGPGGATSVSNVIANSHNIISLIMQSCAFKKEGLFKIAEAIRQNTTLTALDLGLNFHSGTSSKMQKVIADLSESIKNHPKIKYLGISGDGGKLSIGKDITPLFKIFSENPELCELDITGNKIGDNLAVDFCSSLQSNTNLKSIRWDKNNIGVGGWQALMNLLNTNKTICHVPFPRIDFEKIEKEGKHPKAKELMESISTKLRTNSGGTFYESVVKDTTGRTYEALVPSYLNYEEGGSSSGSDPLYPSSSSNSVQSDDGYSGWGLPPRDYSNDLPPTPPSFQDESPLPPVDASFVADYQGTEFDDSQYDESQSGDMPPPPPPPIF